MDPKPAQPHPNDDGTAMSNQEELILLAKAKAGDREAILKLWAKYVRLVKAIIRYLLGYYSDVEDLAQEVYLKFSGNIATFQGKGPFRAWVAQIARNQCFGHLEKRRFETQLPEEFADTTEDPALNADIVRQLVEVDEALATMKPKEQLVVRAKLEGWKTDAEVAEQTGLSKDQVRGIIRALRRKFGGGHNKARGARFG